MFCIAVLYFIINYIVYLYTGIKHLFNVENTFTNKRVLNVEILLAIILQRKKFLEY